MTPLLTVCIITYNHEKYIREAIEGVLMQNVNFFFEIIIADDCSTDNTRAILLEYKEKYPELFNFIFQEKNIGAAQNWFQLINAPKSKYIAYFEGDDYWTDPLKLQKQVDFLEDNLSYVATYHRYAYKYPNKYSVQCLNNEFNLDTYYKDTITIIDLLKTSKIRTLTVVFRNILIENPLPNYLLDLKFGDWPLFLHLSRFGNFKLLDIIGVYRINTPNSVANSIRKDLAPHIIFFYNYLLNDINYRFYKKIILTYVIGITIQILKKSIKQYNISNTIRYLIKLIKYSFLLWIVKKSAPLN